MSHHLTADDLILDRRDFLRRCGMGFGGLAQGLGLGFRSALGEKVTLVARARYFISNLEVYNNTLYAEDFAELSLAANYHFNQNFFLGLRLSKNVGQYDDLRYGLSAAFSF